jgi:hypothetical protein
MVILHIYSVASTTLQEMFTMGFVYLGKSLTVRLVSHHGAISNSRSSLRSGVIGWGWLGAYVTTLKTSERRGTSI